MQDHPFDPTDLTWLAGLARALLGEAHAADDLVQETLVAAIEGASPPPVAAGPRRAWLRSVAQRLAARRFRTEARRRERERAAATPEALPDSTELVTRAEVAQRLTAAARRLEEPFRRTILLRFLEGLSTEEIARSEGKPVDTVRWRVRRGLELLRAELIRSDGGDWSSWSVLLTPLARSGGSVGSAAAGASGVFLGTAAAWTAMKLSLLVGTALAGLGLWWMWGWGEPAEGESPLAAAPAVAEELQPSVARAPDLPGGDGRALVIPSDPDPAPVLEAEPLAEADEARLFGTVLDETGAPVPGATVYLVPEAGPERPAFSVQREAAVARVSSDAAGKFRFPAETLEPLDWEQLDLGAVANGYLRTLVPDIASGLQGAQGAEGLLVTLELGRRFSARVVDSYGVPVPELELLVHTAEAGIGHVSPSQMRLRSERAWLGDAASAYDQSRGRTDSAGWVEFRGLPEVDTVVRSMDPGWVLEELYILSKGQAEAVWVAKRQLGVAVDVFDLDTGEPVELGRLVFRVELSMEDGEVLDFGQWVGRGRGGASFILGPGTLPDLGGRAIVGATFYGQAQAGEGEPEDWRAGSLHDSAGVARARVGVLTREVDDLGEPEALPEPPTAVLELFVSYPDGSPFTGGLAVEWVTRTADDRLREGVKRLAGPDRGRYLVELSAGDVALEVSDRKASGSLPAWNGRVSCGPAGAIARVVLPRGGSATIERPARWSGEWFLHASYRRPGEDEWRGSWNHSTEGDELTLSALEPAEWRFRLTWPMDREAEPLVRTVILADGDSRVVR